MGIDEVSFIALDQIHNLVWLQAKFSKIKEYYIEETT